MEGLRGAPELLLLVLLSLAGGSLSALTHHSVPEGDPVTLECGMSNPPSPSELLQWSVTQRGGPDHTLVTRLEDGRVVKGADPQNRFSLLHDSSLRISSVKPGDAGLYSCNRQLVAVLQVTTGDSKITKAPGTESPSPAGGSTSHTVHISLVACGLAGLVSAVIATEIRSRRREASGTRTGETP